MQFNFRVPDFWWRHSAGLIPRLLSPLSWLYAQVADRRMAAHPTGQLGIPVICVGNFVMGGSGKTPTVLALTNLFSSKGQNVGFLLRGYKGRTKGPVLVNEEHTVVDVGDEALLYRTLGPTVVSVDRPAGGYLLEQNGVDVVLMDDGFQNAGLKKSINLVVVDSHRGWGNGQVFPMGPLRASLDHQFRFADALVVIGSGSRSSEIQQVAGEKNLRCFDASVFSKGPTLAHNSYAVAYSGTAFPEKFFDTLRTLSIEVKETHSFPDHHSFTEKQAAELLRRADQFDGELITTEKDHVRLMHAEGDTALAELRDRSSVLPIELEFERPDDLLTFISSKIDREKNAGLSSG